MFQLLAVSFIIKLYARSNIFHFLFLLFKVILNFQLENPDCACYYEEIETKKIPVSEAFDRH